MSLCVNRLQEERKQWRKDHPFGFFAKPVKGENGILDLKVWEVGIPGKIPALKGAHASMFSTVISS